MIDWQFENAGFQLFSKVVPDEVVDFLISGLTPSGGSPNRRSLLRDNAMVAAFACKRLKRIADGILIANSIPVRALLFDKIEGANWSVPWHQDVVIAVATRVDTPGFCGWSIKDGIPHVVAPAEVLEKMVTLRVHLDDCTGDNGPLRVLPGSHRDGILDDRAINCWRAKVPEVVCAAPRGSVVAMRPLLLHASSSAQSAAHRRILHVEFASEPLPGGLHWAETSHGPTEHCAYGFGAEEPSRQTISTS